MALGRQAIVKAAFDLLERKGFDGLGLRPLAADLGVQAPALYWYVKGKGHLLALMAEQIYEGARVRDGSGNWQEQLYRFGVALRTELVTRRDAFRVCAMAEPLEKPSMSADRLSAPFLSSGLSQEQALSRQAVVISYALGWALYEQSRPMHRHLAEIIDFDQDFKGGLRAIVRGFEVMDD